MRILTPAFKPVGGVVKIFDYVTHCLALGMEPIVYCPEQATSDLPLFSIDHFSGIVDSVQIEQLSALRIEKGDFVLFSWPTHYGLISERIEANASNREVIHIVQNTRHANPQWLQGYATRLLTRPFTRIMVADPVREACEPFLNPSSLTTTIVEGHNWEYFSKDRGGGGFTHPIRVAYTTWKSDIGSRVERELAGSSDFSFRHISETVGWKELRDLYHWCDVFLAAPGPQEGFYLPGLEAMAAGAILVTPDVGGNMQYCEFGGNCLEAQFDDLESYVSSLTRVSSMSVSEISRIREEARRSLDEHTLNGERQGFGSLLSGIMTSAKT